VTAGFVDALFVKVVSGWSANRQWTAVRSGPTLAAGLIW
jgi:hypothetical protein